MPKFKTPEGARFFPGFEVDPDEEMLPPEMGKPVLPETPQGSTNRPATSRQMQREANRRRYDKGAPVDLD